MGIPRKWRVFPQKRENKCTGTDALLFRTNSPVDDRTKPLPIPNSFLRNAAHGNFAARHISTDLLIIDPPAPLSGNIIITKTKFDNTNVQTTVITITNTNEYFRTRTGPNRSPLMLAHDLASPLSLTTRRNNFQRMKPLFSRMLRLDDPNSKEKVQALARKTRAFESSWHELSNAYLLF